MRASSGFRRLRAAHLFLRLFFNDDLLNLMVTETNRSVGQKIMRAHEDWTDTTTEEMKKFMDICIYMGIVRLLKPRDYWSTRPIFGNSFAAAVLRRNRFEALLGFLHFADNDNTDKKNRLYNAQPVSEKLNALFQRIFMPGRELCTDESMAPFR